MAILLRIRDTEFDATQVLLPQQFHRLQALRAKNSLTPQEQRELQRLMLLAYKEHMGQVARTVDSALNGDQNDPKVDRLVAELFG
ncbi:MAG: hypothetical protein LAN63_08180 [Acidobacteriia bacterium]|nr:hypothetical protein [Terriglobia bacterium]